MQEVAWASGASGLDIASVQDEAPTRGFGASPEEGYGEA